jgi:hypothetical protein
VQSNILSRASGSDLRVFVIWVPFMAGTRSAVNTGILPDARVTDLWDGTALSSTWFGQHVLHNGWQVWDYYLLFGPKARWGASVGPVITDGGPVIADTGRLISAIQPYLR